MRIMALYIQVSSWLGNSSSSLEKLCHVESQAEMLLTIQRSEDYVSH